MLVCLDNGIVKLYTVRMSSFSMMRRLPISLVSFNPHIPYPLIFSLICFLLRFSQISNNRGTLLLGEWSLFLSRIVIRYVDLPVLLPSDSLVGMFLLIGNSILGERFSLDKGLHKSALDIRVHSTS